ncbi:MAG: RNA polymerase sigma factor [Patescibacteria group bacterium]|jgi:RNA polymerase sigma-70 factor (ECF subfamily)
MFINGDCQDKTDEELIKLTLKDAEWYGCLMQRYEGKISRYIYRISGTSKEDIEDLLQEIFINAYKNINDFDVSLKFSSWIYRIAHNMVISHFRKSQARPQTITGEEGEKLLTLIKESRNIESELDQKINSRQVHDLLSLMDEKYREVLVLKYLEEKDYQEISDILKKPMGTVATLLNRAKKQLKEIALKENIKL